MSADKMKKNPEAAKAVKIEEARTRCHRAGRVYQQLKEDVSWLVSERAWDLLGYGNFTAMWKGENAFKCPTEA